MHIYADDQWSIPADSAYVELAGEMFSMLTDPTRDGTLTPRARNRVHLHPPPSPRPHGVHLMHNKPHIPLSPPEDHHNPHNRDTDPHHPPDDTPGGYTVRGEAPPDPTNL